MINDLNRWTVGWIDWNLLLDEHRRAQPRRQPVQRAGAGRHARSGTLLHQSSYWYLGHFARFIAPGARRVLCAATREALEATAFANPDGSVGRGGDEPHRRARSTSSCAWPATAAASTLPPRSIATYLTAGAARLTTADDRTRLRDGHPDTHRWTATPCKATSSRTTAETWYRIDGIDRQPPFFMALAGDSDLWAFVSTAGSLAAGRRDAEGAFLPYETVDKIHLRWEHTGPRTWILIDGARRARAVGAVRAAPGRPRGAALGVEEPVGHAHPLSRGAPLGPAAFRVRVVHRRRAWAWCAARACEAPRGHAVPVQVLDGVLNLVPPGVELRACPAR